MKHVDQAAPSLKAASARFTVRRRRRPEGLVVALAARRLLQLLLEAGPRGVGRRLDHGARLRRRELWRPRLNFAHDDEPARVFRGDGLRARVDELEARVPRRVVGRVEVRRGRQQIRQTAAARLQRPRGNSKEVGDDVRDGVRLRRGHVVRAQMLGHDFHELAGGGTGAPRAGADAVGRVRHDCVKDFLVCGGPRLEEAARVQTDNLGCGQPILLEIAKERLLRVRGLGLHGGRLRPAREAGPPPHGAVVGVQVFSAQHLPVDVGAEAKRADQSARDEDRPGADEGIEHDGPPAAEAHRRHQQGKFVVQRRRPEEDPFFEVVFVD
mmetsp:Transcript_26090/g.87677  ORF Transcript_26090/g.87677 Transcript_26090/m.87677 type:complete len:325 (+) Transcript_26090:29-1003(+)